MTRGSIWEDVRPALRTGVARCHGRAGRACSCLAAPEALSAQSAKTIRERRPLMKLVILLLSAALTGIPSPAPAEDKATAAVAAASSCNNEDQTGVPVARLRALARGFSLPGWTDRWPPRAPDERMLAQLRTMGLTHVRLPLLLERLSPAFSGPAVIAQSLQQTDHAVEILLQLGYAVTLDMHPAERFQELHQAEPDQGLAILAEVWQRLATRYANTAPDRIFFEILNEPSVPSPIWLEQGPQIVAIVRRAAPDHTIIYGPAFYQRYEALQALTPLADPNIVYAFHFYDPMAFTHQGQTWGRDPPPSVGRIPFPAGLADIEPLIRRLQQQGQSEAAESLSEQFREPWTPQTIDRIFAGVADWAASHARPVIVNEFGVLSFRADPQSRAAWIRAVRTAAERYCIGWTHWEYADGFGFVRRTGSRETIDPVVGPALTAPLGSTPVP